MPVPTIKLRDSQKGSRVPAKKEIDESTYSGRIAARMRELRTAKGWTVAELLERVNTALPKADRIAQQTLHNWDQGKRKIDPDYYPAIASAFGLSTRGFLPSE